MVDSSLSPHNALYNSQIHTKTSGPREEDGYRVSLVFRVKQANFNIKCQKIAQIGGFFVQNVLFPHKFGCIAQIW